MAPAIELPVVVPRTPARIFSAVEFPNVLPVTVIEAAIAETLTPKTAPGFAAVGLADVNAPNVLLLMTIVPVVALLTPMMAAAVVVVGVVVNEPVPDVEPKLFGVTLPILTLPEVTLTPASDPLPEFVPMPVNDIEATELPWTEVVAVVPTARLMATNRVATVPPIV